MKSFLIRRFRFAAGVLLALMAIAQVIAALEENQNWDEGIHLAAGYSYWKTGDFRLNQEHPPLFKLIATAPLLLLNPSLPLDTDNWRRGLQIDFGDQFMYLNRVPADRMLFVSRLPIIALTLALGLAILWFTRRRFGEIAALLALFLFATDPNFIAHGHYATNDVLVALGSFLAIVCWLRYLENRTWRDLLLAALALGLALSSKFSGLFVLPVIFVLGFAKMRRPWGRNLLRLVGALAVVAVIAVILVGATYGAATIRAFSGARLTEIADRNNPGGDLLYRLGEKFNLPAHPYLWGLNRTSQVAKGGHHAYLLGMRYDHGWWYYYPVVFAVKTPTAVLLLTLACFWAAVWWVARRRAGTFRFEWVVLTLPIVVYWLIIISSSIDLGVRYLLPVYPFLFILLAAVLAPAPEERTGRAVPAVLAVAVLLQLFEVGLISPHYTAFFNTVSGGPGNGPHYLVDSNNDWGQDLKKLHRYLESINWKEDVCFSYFGRADATYYKVGYQYLPETNQTDRRAKVDCLAAVSVTQLYEAYTPPGVFRWLRELKPIEKVGYSIYIYDLRKRKGS
jgi:predicted membrane-bound dolichyl-phosphate-mannose-protein mannosyltransferase